MSPQNGLLWPSVLSSVAADPSCCSLSFSVPRVSHSLPCHLLVLLFLACSTPLEFHPQRLRIPRLHLASFLRAMAATQSSSPCLRGFRALGSRIWSLKWEGNVLTRRPGPIGNVTPFERPKSRESCYVCPHHNCLTTKQSQCSLLPVTWIL